MDSSDCWFTGIRKRFHFLRDRTEISALKTFFTYSGSLQCIGMRLTGILSFIGRWESSYFVVRLNYDDPNSPVPPPYSFYTGLDLYLAFLVFWIIFFLHISAILITKLLTVRSMRESANILDKILHAVHNSNIPFPYKDWDVDDGTVEEHRGRFKATLREVNCVMVVNLFFNSLLLGPLIYTGMRNQT